MTSHGFLRIPPEPKELRAPTESTTWPAETHDGCDIAIVGGGASGVLLALRLMRSGHAGLRVAVIERSGRFGRGLAYSTSNPLHLLNTKASDMSASPEEPDQFAHWLARREPRTEADFVPRELFGSYLEEQFDEAVRASSGSLIPVIDEVVALDHQAGHIVVRGASWRELKAGLVVLATGHGTKSENSDAWRGDPWTFVRSELGELDTRARVLLLGAGLTAIDVALSLIGAGHEGEITALSRRGLFPRAHGGPAPSRPVDTEAFRSGRLSQRLARFRALQRAGHGWPGIFQSLRPINASLWQALALEERRRFIRHLRPWWDVHRHRMAPEVAQRLEQAQASGQFVVRAGRVQSIFVDRNSATVTISGRGQPWQETRRFDRVIDCRGTDCSISAGSPVLRHLRQTGLAQSDALDLGLAVTAGGAVVSREGLASHRLFALGPPARGELWESTAIPDIRQQAAAMAHVLIRTRERMRSRVGERV